MVFLDQTSALQANDLGFCSGSSKITYGKALTQFFDGYVAAVCFALRAFIHGRDANSFAGLTLQNPSTAILLRHHSPRTLLAAAYSSCEAVRNLANSCSRKLLRRASSQRPRALNLEYKHAGAEHWQSPKRKCLRRVIGPGGALGDSPVRRQEDEALRNSVSSSSINGS